MWKRLKLRASYLPHKTAGKTANEPNASHIDVAVASSNGVHSLLFLTVKRFYTKEMDPFVRFFAFYLHIPLVDFFAVFEKNKKKLGTVNQ